MIIFEEVLRLLVYHRHEVAVTAAKVAHCITLKILTYQGVELGDVSQSIFKEAVC
jgi:hypothetical protein